MSVMVKNKLFNPAGDREFEKRLIIGGNSTNLFELNNIKYDWAMKLYRDRWLQPLEGIHWHVL